MDIRKLIVNSAKAFRTAFISGQDISTEPLKVRTSEQRKQILKDFVINQVTFGSRVVLQEDFDAVLVYGKNPNHILHLLLSIITLGLWIFVWILLYFTSREKRYSLHIDEYGVITKDWQAPSR
jgi:hypothetical protein